MTHPILDKATTIAQKAQTKWAALSYAEKAAILRKAAEHLSADQAELLPLIMRETGSIAPKAETELKLSQDILYAAADLTSSEQGLVLPSATNTLSFARRLPLGIVGIIAPFNFPFLLAMRAIAPALAMGNAVILKPDPKTLVSGGALIAELFEKAGLPNGLLQVLGGSAEIGEALCSHPSVKLIAFTGSTETGRRVNELCAQHLKKVSLELGGNNAIIVLEDADLDLAASNVAFGAWLHQGQICMSAQRILVHKNIAEQFVTALADKADHLPVGDPMTEQVALGPMINKEQLDAFHEKIQASIEQGAIVKAGASFDGLFYRPTVLDEVTPSMPAFKSEMFGPVAAITRFKTLEEAILLANQTDYGLAASIFSKDVGRAMSLSNSLNVGLLHINDQPVQDAAYVPFGGQGASGNGSRIGGIANKDLFSQWQWVTVKNTPPQYPF